MCSWQLVAKVQLDVQYMFDGWFGHLPSNSLPIFVFSHHWVGLNIRIQLTDMLLLLLESLHLATAGGLLGCTVL
jgi:hypothetical protein